MVANVTITNTAPSAVNGWSLIFTFPGDTKIGSSWNATVTQSGTVATATNMSYNGRALTRLRCGSPRTAFRSCPDR